MPSWEIRRLWEGKSCPVSSVENIENTLSIISHTDNEAVPICVPTSFFVRGNSFAALGHSHCWQQTLLHRETQGRLAWIKSPAIRRAYFEQTDLALGLETQQSWSPFV